MPVKMEELLNLIRMVLYGLYSGNEAKYEGAASVLQDSFKNNV